MNELLAVILCQHNVQQQYQNSAVLSIKHNEQKLIQWVMVYEK